MLIALSHPQNQARSQIGSSGVSFGLGQIEIPPYLDPRQIVTLTNRNELDLTEFDQCAEPQHDGIIRVLAEYLERYPEGILVGKRSYGG